MDRGTLATLVSWAENPPRPLGTIRATIQGREFDIAIPDDTVMGQEAISAFLEARMREIYWQVRRDVEAVAARLASQIAAEEDARFLRRVGVGFIQSVDEVSGLTVTTIIGEPVRPRRPWDRDGFQSHKDRYAPPRNAQPFRRQVSHDRRQSFSAARARSLR